MKKIFVWIILIVFLALGMGGSYALSSAFRTEAVEAWKSEASQAARWLSGTVLNWLEESYAPVSGLAILFENPEKVTEDEFLGAAEALETRATAYFIDGIAVVRQRKGSKEWFAAFSDEGNSSFSLANQVNNSPVILEGIKVAMDHPGRIMLGSPLSDEDGSIYSPIVLALDDVDVPVVIVGLVNYDAITQGLFDIHKPEGLQLQIQGSFQEQGGPGPQRPVIGKPVPNAPYSVTTRTISAGADLSITWYATAQFSDGPQENLADFTLMGGMGVTILITLFMGMLLQRNRSVTKRVEEATNELTKSRQELEMALDAAQVGLWTDDILADKWDWDSRTNRMMGFPENAPPDLDTWVAALHPEDRDHVLEEFEAAIRGEKIYDVEYRVLWPDGTVRYIVSRGKMTRDERGEPARIDGVTYDLSELRKAQEDMRETEERFRNMVANVPGVIYQCLNDEHWTMKYISNAAQDLTGYPADDFMEPRVRSYASIIHPEDRKRVDDEIQASHEKDESFLLEYRIIRSDRSIRWVNERGRAAGGEKETEQRINGAIFDITERKQMEDALREKVEELNETQSTMLKMMEDLGKEKQRAEEATKAKSEFLANMSHEIRTPMNAILGMGHLALSTDLSPKQRDYVSKIQSSAKALLGIINDILDFSKIEADKLDMEKIPFNLEGVLENVSNLIGAKSQEKGLELLFDTGLDVPRNLVGDPLRLGQVLTHLGNNAVKFTEKGEIVIRTELVEQKEKEVQLRFTVKDSGIGLTDEQQKNLFQAFSQADTTTTRKYGGTGLGLTISKRLVNMMGGDIGVESVSGEGASFNFSVKLIRGEEEKKREPLPDPDPTGMRVLVVDDNATVREILEGILTSMSFIEKENIDGAIRLSHTLKGVAGNIGATKLHRSAQKLEAVLSGDGPGEPKIIWADTKDCLVKTLDTLKPFLTTEEPTPETSDTEPLSDDMDTETLMPSLLELKEMLEQFNGDAEQVLSEILEKIKGTKLSLPFDAIQKHLSNYDFESALTELESVSERFDIAL
jgi:PAS domain S-box-containing protein